MRNNLEARLYYYTISYLIEYLIFAPISELDTILNEEKDMIETDFFTDYLCEYIRAINESKNYPKQIKENLFKIVSFLENIKGNSNIDKLKEEVIKLDTDSYDKYLSEFELRYVTYDNLINKTTEVIDMDAFSSNLKLDYQFLCSMYVVDDTYNESFLPKFSMNKEYLSSVKKILTLCPDLLKLKEFKERIVYQLNYNIQNGKERTKDIIKRYVLNNYDLTKKDIIVINDFDYDNFITDSEDLLFQVEKNKFINDLSFTQFYYYLKLINQLYSDKKATSFPREILYGFIEDNEKFTLITENLRDKLYSIMGEVRKNLAGDALIEFNEYLSRLNVIDIDDNYVKASIFTCRATKKEYLDYIVTRIINIMTGIYEVIQTPNTYIMDEVNDSVIYDFPNLNILLLPDNEYEIEKVHIKYLEHSVIEYLKRYPDLFLNKKILDRTIEYLENKEDKEIQKIVKKLKKRL
jgi:hypothetical protein